MVNLEERKVLDHGFIALDDFCARDLDVVNAARVSLHKRHTSMEVGDEGLIKFLMKNKHGTPFEHNFFRFRVKAPIFVFREWHRHRIGHSYNEWSARYSTLEPVFYIPEIKDIRKQVGKPGAYTYVPAEIGMATLLREMLEESCGRAYDNYEWALDNFAREQARLFLPVNIYSEMYWSCNARSLMAFLELRNSDQAQWEIRQYAIMAEKIFNETMPITAQAFAETRIAP